MKLLVLLTVLSISATYSVNSKNYLFSTENIEKVSKTARTWTVGKPNFPEKLTLENLRRMGGVLDSLADITARNLKLAAVEKFNAEVANVDIPGSFDSRKEWPECEEVIENIRYQGICASCYAFAAAEVMSDRLCIRTNGTVKFIFSPEEILTCCTDCGKGCAGGYIFEPYVYWNTTGIPSGGDQDSHIGCKPYTAQDTMTTPNCTNSCESGYNKYLNSDRKYGMYPYYVNNSVQDIQLEIMTNGPVEAYFALYNDFYLYVGGIFNSSMEDYVTGHAVKIIGWDEEDGIPYWIVANSWSSIWGESGYFRVVRGENNCYIEEGVLAANPYVDTDSINF